MLVVRALVLGLHINVVAPTATPITAATKHYDFSAFVPMQLQNSIPFIDVIGKLIVGGAALTKDLKHAVQNTTCHIYETYGMTETITHIAARKVNHIKTENTKHSVRPFQVLQNVAITTDNRNCLVIDAPQVSKGKIVTNDIVTLVSESEFLWLGN